MSELFLNELSLNGQYETVDDFLYKNRDVIECIAWAAKRGNMIYKKSDFFNSKITMDKTLQQGLGGYRSSNGELVDLLRRYKLLLVMANSNPFWDVEFDYNCEKCMIDNIDVSNSSIVPAAKREGALLSFCASDYTDKVIEALFNGKQTKVISISSPFMYSEYLLKTDIDNVDDFFKLRYRGTKLNFSKLEEAYGFNEFQNEEIKDCIHEFDRFIKMDWNQILNDNSFHYKSYKPSKSKNWFLNSEHKDEKIDKFRCINPKRCFGVRKGEEFYAYRMERDHSISNYG